MIVTRFLKNISKGRFVTQNTIKIQQIQWRPNRFIKTTTNYHVKLFIDAENNFAHNVLQRSSRPYQLVRSNNIIVAYNEDLKLPIMADTMEATELFECLQHIVNYCTSTTTSITNEMFNDFVKVFNDNRSKLNDEQLLESLQLLKQLPIEDTIRSTNYLNLWNTIDIECCRRIDNWTTDQLLLVCDAWYNLNLARVCKYVSEALHKMARKITRMTPEQLVQSMFLCNVLRKPIYDMINFEVNLINCIETLTLEELGIMAMGFFKTKTQIRNPVLIDALYKRLLAELDTVGDYTLSALLKILRYSSKLNHVNLLEELMDSLRNHLDRYSLLSCLHISLLGTDIQCCNDALTEQILQRFSKHIEETRLKDLERICLVMGMYNYRSNSEITHELCGKIIQQLHQRIDEILRHPRCFPTCLHYLTMMNYYDNELLSAALDPRFIRHAYGRNLLLGREIFQLDSFIKINLQASDYDGHQLADKQRKSMGKLLTHYIPERNSKYKLSATDQILMEINETIVDIVKEATFKHVLPHFERPDIVVVYDKKQRKAIPISEHCPDNYTGVILRRADLLGDIVDTSDYEIIIVTVAGWNNVVRDKQRYTGLFELKLKQLKLLDYKVFAINWYEWRELETAIDRRDFINRKINAFL